MALKSVSPQLLLRVFHLALAQLVEVAQILVQSTETEAAVAAQLAVFPAQNQEVDPTLVRSTEVQQAQQASVQLAGAMFLHLF